MPPRAKGRFAPNREPRKAFTNIEEKPIFACENVYTTDFFNTILSCKNSILSGLTTDLTTSIRSISDVIQRVYALQKTPKINIFHTSGCGAVGSARRLGRRCRRFESCHSDQNRGFDRKIKAVRGILAAFFIVLSQKN